MRSRHLDTPRARGPDEQLLESIERWPAVASRLGFNDEAAEECTHTRNEDANVLLVLPVPLVNGADIVKFGFKAGDRVEHPEPDARELDYQGSFLDLLWPQARQGNRQSQSGIGRWHPSFVEAAIIHDLKAFSTVAKEGIRALKLVPADLAPGQYLQVLTPRGLFSFQGQRRVSGTDFEARLFQAAFHSPSPCVARFHASILPVGYLVVKGRVTAE